MPIVSGLLAGALLCSCTTHKPVESLRQSGDHNYRIGDYAAAAHDYEMITERYPGDWRAQYQLGMTRLELGELSAARQALEIAHARRPRDSDVIEELADVMLRQGDKEAVFELLRHQTEVSPSTESYLRLARYSMALDDPDSARSAVLTAMELDGGWHVDPYLVAADLSEQFGDEQGAKRRLRQAYWIDDEDPRVVDRLRAMGEVPGPTLALPPRP